MTSLSESAKRIAPSAGVDAAALKEVQSDFGRIAVGEADGVATPSTTNELRELVSEARRLKTHITIRGGGMSQSGQCLSRGGIVLSMSHWKQILDIDEVARTATVQPGVTWRELLASTLPLGLVPKVQPLNLDLTIGGTLSAGGVGSTSHRQGFAVSHVRSALVVLGSGELVTTGPFVERDVFDAVFGGLGRCGIICSVQLELERAPAGLHVFTLRYSHPDALVRDQLELARQDWAYHVGGLCASSVHGLRKSAEGRREPLRHWSFGLEIAIRDEGKDPVSSGLLDGLGFAEMMHQEADQLGAFLARYDIRFEMMRATGAWQEAHPWFEALVPLEHAANTLGQIMKLPAFLGDSHRVTIVADRERPLSVAFPCSGPALMLAVLPTGIAAPIVPLALRALSALDAHIHAVGGRRYLSGWLSRTDAAAWKAHYGVDYARLVSLGSRFDPDGIIRSKLGGLLS